MSEILRSKTTKKCTVEYAMKKLTIPKGTKVRFHPANINQWVVDDAELLSRLSGRSVHSCTYALCAVPLLTVEAYTRPPVSQDLTGQAVLAAMKELKDQLPTMRERACILAGLRLVQAYLPQGEALPQGVHAIYEDAGEGLSVEEIDDLCERLNQ